MKKTTFENSLKAAIFLMLSCFLVTGAMAQSSITIKVNPKPKGTITTSSTDIKTVDNVNYVCSGKIVDFELIIPQPIDGSTVSLKEWEVSPDSANINSNSISAANITFTNRGTTNLEVIIKASFTTSNNCSNDTTYAVTILPAPRMTITGLTNNQAICTGTSTTNVFDMSVTYVAPASLPAGAILEWVFENASSSNITGNFVTPSTSSTESPTIYFENDGATAGTIDVVLYYTDPQGACRTKVDMKTITVNPAPQIIDQSVTADGTTPANVVCHNGTLKLAATLSDGTALTSWAFEQVTSITDMSIVTTTGTVVFDPTNQSPTSATFTNTTTEPIYIRIKVDYLSVTCGNTENLYMTQIITVYPEITAKLELASTENSDLVAPNGACATNSGATTQNVQLKITVAGGCPDAESYQITLKDTPSGTLSFIGDADVSAVGNTLTITKVKANVGAEFTVIVPVDSSNYEIKVEKVTQTGNGATAPCNCTQPFN